MDWFQTPAKFMVMNGMYQKANEYCRSLGIEEFRIDEIRPNGPDKNHVYWLHEYYPSYLSDDKVSIKIRGLKDGAEDAAYDFGMEILGVLKLLYMASGRNEYHLVCIPSHLEKEKSMMERCIDRVIELNDTEKLMIYRDTISITRVKSVNPSHAAAGERASVEEQMASIQVKVNTTDLKDKNIILLDDVTTTGKQMNAVRNKLLRMGIREERLFQLAIGKTKTE